jgi:diaminopimelate epimerase
MIEIGFTKMNGAGNDFVVIDDFDGKLKVELPALARTLCSKGFGIGADGLLVMRKHPSLDFEMIYLNSDGSEGGMCGNGGRCIARFAVLSGVCKSPMQFTAHGGNYSAEVLDAGRVRLHFPDPEKVTPSIEVPIGSQRFDATYVHPNTDHTVLPGGTAFDRVDSADLITIARKIRYNFGLFPRGTNVNLIEQEGDNLIRMRTYERGVENETLACGTGAVASAITASLRYGMTSPVGIKTSGGEVLTVFFERTGSHFSNLILEGNATMVFRGKVLYDESLHKIVDLEHGQGTI